MHKIAVAEGIKQKQSYIRVSKEQLRKASNRRGKNQEKEAKKATGQLKREAEKVVKELEEKLGEKEKEKYQKFIVLIKQVLSQEKESKNKVYSLHKPYTSCIAKGKAGKPYEFGNKIGLMVDKEEGIVIGVKGFEGNPYDNKTIEPLIKELKEMGIKIREVVYDRGGRGREEIEGVKISIPKKLDKDVSKKERESIREKFRARAGIEGIISHLKRWYRMGVNYYSCLGFGSVQMNAYLSAAAWNLKKWMEKAIRFIFDFIWRMLIETKLDENFVFKFIIKTKVNF